MRWMDAIFLSNNKVSEHKSGPFEDAQSMSKWPTGLVYTVNFINYLSYLPVSFPRDLCIDLEGSSTFLPLMLLMHINILGLFSNLYRTLLNCLSACLGSWAGATTLCIEVEWRYTVAVSAWCSTHQLPGCEGTGNISPVPVGYQNGASMGIYSHIQPYIHAFTCMFDLKIYVCIISHLYVYLLVLECFYICRNICI